MSNYALTITSGNVSMPGNNAYNVGAGAFTVLALIKPSGTGTIVSRKGSSGGSNNGGWLLVVESNNVLKFATDDGFGYYQITGTASNLHDGYWHFIAAVRSSAGVLTFYVDGILLPTTVQTNRSTPLNINNSLPLMIGGTAQVQEPCNQYNGMVMNVSLWNHALAQADVIAAMVNPVNAAGAIGCWTLDNNYTDSSPTKNNGTAAGSGVAFTQLYMTMPFKPQPQLNTNWCWAAASTATSVFYNPLSAWTQCLVANACLSLTVCCNTPTPGQCNVYGYLDLALTKTGNFVSVSGGTTTFANCTTQMNTWRVLGARIAWSGGGAHFVMMSGVSLSGGTQYVTIRDSIYGTSTILYTTFLTNYQGTGTWTTSYFTKP
jgi:concanavalin A-like lectin/glucanase superfamily protein